MILDKPKRRAETILGLLEVTGGDKSTVARDQRTRRALKDAGEHFGLTISIGEMTGYLHTSRNFARLTITAVIHSESLESRWARALDMIRDQYGLQIEWERQEVRERCRIVPPVEESFGPVNIEIGEGEVARIPGTYSVYLGGNRIDVPVSEETTAEEIAAALNKKAGYDFAMASEETAKSLRSDPNRTFIADTEHDPKPPRKSYADTPTGTVDFDEKKGESIGEKVELLENKGCFGLIKPFRDALHLVPYENEFCGSGTNIICPVCGDGDLSGWYLYASHVSELFGALKYTDQNVVKELKSGITCTECNHHLTYDFDNETVTIRTTSSHCMERGE